MNPSLSIRTRRWDDAIARLDAEADAVEIVRILTEHVFPVETLIALEIAQLRTFTIPSISKILHATRQFEHEGTKRLDDTRAILTEILRPGLATEPSHEMVTHLNRIHGLYPITNDDYLYTLSTFIFDPVLFIDCYGHRPMTEKEKKSFYTVYRQLGERMKIQDIPPSFEAFYEWRCDYERRCQRFSADNQAVARGMIAAASKMVPGLSPESLEALIVTLIDDEGFRESLGLTRVGLAPRASVRLGRVFWRFATRFLTGFDEVGLWSTAWFNDYPTYPTGYERLRLGPKKVLAMLERSEAAHN